MTAINTLIEDKEPPHFKDWYDTKLLVVGYPVVSEVTKPDGKYNSYDVFINVSDEYWMEYQAAFWRMGKQNHWFPMGEAGHDMGLISIFAALQVLYNAHQRNMAVLLHCHAGVNRSQTVRACFHYLMTGTHIENKKVGLLITRQNMLFHNCEFKHLPELAKMEAWLQACKDAFDNSDAYLGGMYDMTLLKSKLLNL